MADENNLMIEVTGSANKAVSALDKVIERLSNLQATFDKAMPSVTAFTEKLNQIPGISKALNSMKDLNASTSKSALSAKDAESKMAMYQARLDRATASMERSKVASEKLAAARQKLNSSSVSEKMNNEAFSLSPQEFKAKYEHVGKGIRFPQYEDEVPMPSTPAGQHSVLASQIPSNMTKSGISFNTTPAISAIDEVRNYIDGLSPSISRMSNTAQADFERLSAELVRIASQIENQRGLYSQLASAATGAANANGEGSKQYLQLEKRMLSADGAIDRLISKQDKLKSQLSEISDGAGKSSFGFHLFGNNAEQSSSKATTGFQKTLQMMEKMFIRIAAFRIFSAVQQSITQGLQNIALANSQANATMSEFSTSALYLKNSIAAALMPVLQALVPIVNQVADAIAGIFNTIAMLTARIFNNASTVTIAKRANVNYAETLNKSGDAAGNANKKLKEYQNTVLGFDELNKLSSQNDSSSAGSSGGAGAGMPSYGSMFETVKIPDWVNNIGTVTDSIGKFIKDWWSSLTSKQKWGAGIGGTAGFVIGGIIGGLIGGPIGKVVGAVLGGVAGVIIGSWWEGLTTKQKWSAGIGASAGAIIGGIIGGLISGPIGIAVGAALGGTIGAIIGKWWADLTNPQKWSAGIGAGAGIVIGGIIGGIIAGPIGIAVGAALGGTIGAIIGKWWADLTNPQKWSAGIGAGAGATVGGILGTLIAPGLGTILGVILGGVVGSVINKWWNDLSDKQRWQMGPGIGIGALLGTIVGGIVGGPLGAVVGGILGASAGYAVTKYWDTFTGKWNEFWNWYGRTVRKNWSEFGSQMGDLGKNVVDAFLWPFRNLRFPSIHVPSFHVSYDKSGWGAQAFQFIGMPGTPNISWYAKGGLFDSPSIIGIGEGADDEAALPLNNNVYSRIGKGIAENGGGGFETERLISRIDDLEKAIRNMHIDVSLYANDKEIANSANRGRKRIDRSTSPIANTR